MWQLSSHPLLKPTSLRRMGSLLFMSWVGLTGCGQAGNLYMPEQANSHTEFLIYKHDQKQDEKQDKKQGDKTVSDDNDVLKSLTPPINTTIERHKLAIDALPEAQNY